MPSFSSIISLWTAWRICTTCTWTHGHLHSRLQLFLCDNVPHRTKENDHYQLSGYKYTFNYKQVSHVDHFRDDAAAYMEDIRKRRPDYLRHECYSYFARKAAESDAEVATGNK